MLDIPMETNAPKSPPNDPLQAVWYSLFGHASPPDTGSSASGNTSPLFMKSSSSSVGSPIGRSGSESMFGLPPYHLHPKSSPPGFSSSSGHHRGNSAGELQDAVNNSQHNLSHLFGSGGAVSPPPFLHHQDSQHHRSNSFVDLHGGGCPMPFWTYSCNLWKESNSNRVNLRVSIVLGEISNTQAGALVWVAHHLPSETIVNTRQTDTQWLRNEAALTEAVKWVDHLRAHQPTLHSPVAQITKVYSSRETGMFPQRRHPGATIRRWEVHPIHIRGLGVRIIFKTEFGHPPLVRGMEITFSTH